MPSSSRRPLVVRVMVPMIAGCWTMLGASAAIAQSWTLGAHAAVSSIRGDDEAAKLVSRRYREGHWAVPKGV